MKSIACLRKRPLAACLAAAFSLGMPLVVESASSDRPTGAQLDDGHALANVRSRLARSASPGGLFQVTNCNDSGAGSLREAVAGAADGDHIDLRPLACSTITLASAIPVGAIDLYIDGPGNDRFTIDGGGASRLFEAGNYRLTLSDLRLTNGFAAGDGGCILSTGYVQLTDSLITGCHVHTASIQARGGAISAQGVGLLRSSVVSNIAESDASLAKGGGLYTVDIQALYSTIDSNEARSTSSRGFGGGAFVRGAGPIIGSAVTRNRAYNAAGLSFVGGAPYTNNINDSTVSGNVAQGFIGGVYANTSMVVLTSTISFNCAEQTDVRPGYVAAVGFEGYQTSPYFTSTIVSNNDLCSSSRSPSSPQGSAFDVSLFGVGMVVSGSHNLIVTSNLALPPDTIRADPMLAPLADHGGRSETHALLPGSPAIDAGSPQFILPWDQRWHWFARVNGAEVDIGAYETQTTGSVHTISTCEDAGDGSLRDAVAGSLSGDVIDLRDLACSRITLTSGAILVPQSNLKLLGPGSENLTIDGNHQDRIFVQNGSGHLELDGLAFENGYYSASSFARGGGCILSFGFVTGSDTKFESCSARLDSSSCYGGAIDARGAALYGTRIVGNSCSSASESAGGGGIAVDYDLTLGNSTVANNVAETDGGSETVGGGFFAYSEALIAFSTISGNQAQIAAGGYAPKLVVSESTISGNAAELEIGGIAAGMGSLDNSTVAFNTAPVTSYDAAAGFFAVARGDLSSSIVFANTRGTDAYDAGTLGALFGSDNLIGASQSLLPPGTISDDPLLGPLQDNGGTTETHALGEGSPALDAGNNDAGFDVDQRGAGFTRVFNGRADIGAIEMQPEPVDAIFADGFEPPG